MYPYINILGINISMMVIWIIIAFIIFLVTARILTRKNHQDFLKLFYWLPIQIILAYILWRYISFALETWNYIPTSSSMLLKILSPQNFNLHFTGLLIASWISLSIFFSGIKRTENKKIWADILFLSFTNALIVFGIFLTLGDSIVWKPTDSIFAIHALSDNSDLTKFNGVYPVWLFLSFWALLVHVLVSIISILSKKNGVWIRWIIWILIVFNIVFLFQYYPRYWVVDIFGVFLDVKQYLSLIAIIHCIITWIRWERKRFY